MIPVSWQTISTTLMLLACTVSAWADGKIVTSVVAAPAAQIPDQRALICFANGVETLVIETSFRAAGTDLAWIVPLPSLPSKIAAATTGLLPTLDFLSKPRLLTGIDPAVLISLLLIGVMVYATWKSRHRSIAWGCLGMMIIIGMIGIGTPVLGGKPPPRVEGVSVLQETIAGVYETTTLSAESPDALANWMREYGWQAPAGFEAAAASYIDRRFVFVASRLRRDIDTSAITQVHPLAFTFAAEKPIYPMRLTGAGATESLALELFVLADARAEVAGLEVQYCAPIGEAKQALPIKHPALAEFASRASIATRLAGTLQPQQMNEDLDVEFVPFRRKQPVVFSLGAIIQIGLLLAVLTAIASQLLWNQRTRRARRARVQLSKEQKQESEQITLIVGVALMMLPFLVLPWTRTRSILHDHRMSVRFMTSDIQDELEEAQPDSLAKIAEIAAPIAAGYVNVFTGRPVRIEDSPGNFTVRMEGIDVFMDTYNDSGNPMPDQFWIIPPLEPVEER